MKLITFGLKKNIKPEDFVDFWKNQYKYPNMEWYTDNINLPYLKYQNLQELFFWKNGMNLSKKKQATFDRISKHLTTINQLRNGFEGSTFSVTFEWMSPVWKIFLLHIIQPTKAPIFDQHIYRAFLYIQQQENDEKASKRIEAIYHNKYITFFEMMKNSCTNNTVKEVDDAIWAFGKFLSLYPNFLP